MQKTNFPFVAIVHDDASTDGTADIIREYAEKYPDIIKPIYETENQYSKRDGSLTRIMKEACEVTGAKYIAMCEGDDYWTDPLKLQKQVDFLESHSEYSLCFHRVDVVSDGNNTQNTACFEHLCQREYTVDEIMKVWTVPTCSTMYKVEMMNKVPYNSNFQYGDNVLWCTCAKYGKLFCLMDKMANYRRNEGGWTSMGSFICNTKQVKHMEALFEEFPNISENIKRQNLKLFYFLSFVTGVRERNMKALNYFYIGLKKFKLMFLIYTVEELVRYFYKNIIKRV